ncbi:GNAT family N-acetyltransferase [Streptomyces mangrovisoli]|uniref:GNAT family N-acetyltransferase n=1 Tax=Streptomyces mangrovisoli TaxID=1428628 RepID=A0A1J4NUL1_9ACTN|nr:GNAT family N-acetyltransferase [Streptomyces mangrovisoli]OIJ64822.1 GNAT family N-acetyltransferase [Streptomyces mangrovisoli]
MTSEAARATGTTDLDIRPITESELADWHRAMRVGFLDDPAVTEEVLEPRRALFVPGRLLGAFDGSRCVATFRSFDQEVTAVGGAPVQADAISNVTVSPTHRRRGLLTRMMGMDLAAAKERGDVVATLIAAEYPIYGRYGFGAGTHSALWTVRVPRTGLDLRWSAPEGGGRIDLVDGEDVRKLGPELHDRVRRQQPGMVSRTELNWHSLTGLVRFSPSWTEPYYAAYRSADGEVQGLVSYKAKSEWRSNQPHDTAEVDWLLASTPAAERALWHFLCSIDWITEVKSGRRAPDDLLPHLFPDARAAELTSLTDWLWIRILDVVAALEARTYDTEGALVLEVTDDLVGGRYRLEAGPEGATCTRTTTHDADLTVEAGALSSLWLGDESAVRLAALGRIREERAGAARSADALLRTSRRPWCPDLF